MRPLILYAIILAFTTIQLRAQIAINKTDSSPDTSAILDVSSTEQGMLLPRMTSPEREAINNPAQGLIVYDNESQSFWFYENSQWNEIRNGSDQFCLDELVDSADKGEIDCTDILSSYEFIISVFDVRFKDNYAFVAGSNFYDDLHVIDVSDPFNPIKVAGLVIESGSNPGRMALDGNYAYLLERLNDYISIVDISDPLNPVKVSSVFSGEQMGQMVAAEGYIYATSYSNDVLYIFDATDPLNPVVDTSFFPGINPKDIAVQGDYLYVLSDEGGNKGIRVYDVSIPDMTVQVGIVNFSDDPEILTVNGDYAYVGDDSQGTLFVVDISDPANPTLVGSLIINGLPTDIVVKGDYAFFTIEYNNNNTGLLRIINIQDPTNPYLQTELEIDDDPESVDVGNGYAYVTDSDSDDLKIIDLSCPHRLVIDPSSGGFSTETAYWNVSDGNGAIGTAYPVRIGNVDFDAESDNQDNSNQNDKGLLSTPWVYTVAVEAHDERDTNGTALIVGNDDNLSGDDQIHLVSGGTSALMVRANGDIGIGTTGPDYKLQVGELADGTIARANVWDTFSDRRLKRNFQLIPDPLEKLQSLNGYYYHWQADKKDQSQHVGLLAQEVEAVFPEVVSTDSKGIKSVDYSKLTALLIETNKALRTKVEGFKAANARFEETLLRIQGQLRPSNSSDID